MGKRTISKKIDKDKLIAIILASLLVFVIILTATLAYFSRDKNVQGQIRLGDIDFSVFSNQIEINDIVPGDVFDNSVSLVNARDVAGRDKNGLCSIFVRYNLNEDINENVVAPVFLSSNFWTKQGDTYYYNYPIAPGDSINLCDKIKFSEFADNSYQNSKIQLTFDVDAIQAENDAYKELWPNSPIEWQQKIESNIS